MGKKQRIKELEKCVMELEARVVLLEIRSTFTWYPQYSEVPQVPQKPTDWWWQPPDYSTSDGTGPIRPY